MEQRNALLAVHGAVLLFALAALFGKWLTIPADVIVLGRTFFAGIALVLFIVFIKKKTLKASPKQLKLYLFTGVLLAVHWYGFFLSIQLSSVAFGLLIFATFPLFTGLLEAFANKTRLTATVLIQGLVLILGIYLIAPVHLAPQQWQLALFAGLISAITFAILVLVNRGLAKSETAYNISAFQNLIAFVCLLPISAGQLTAISGQEVLLLLVLGVVFTAIAHTLLIQSLKGISAFNAAIAVGLEPVYGIIAAWFILHEPLTIPAMIGAGLILAVNLYASFSAQTSKTKMTNNLSNE